MENEKERERKCKPIITENLWYPTLQHSISERKLNRNLSHLLEVQDFIWVSVDQFWVFTTKLLSLYHSFQFSCVPKHHNLFSVPFLFLFPFTFYLTSQLYKFPQREPQKSLNPWKQKLFTFHDFSLLVRRANTHVHAYTMKNKKEKKWWGCRLQRHTIHTQKQLLLIGILKTFCFSNRKKEIWNKRK